MCGLHADCKMLDVENEKHNVTISIVKLNVELCNVDTNLRIGMKNINIEFWRGWKLIIPPGGTPLYGLYGDVPLDRV